MSDEDLLNPPRFATQILLKQIISILTAWGMPSKQAQVASHVMVETDLRGVDSHGINMLYQYEETFRRGALNIKAQTKIIRDRTTTALLDADRGLGHPVSVEAMEMAINKAKNHDVGIVCVTNSHHFGAAGYYAELAAQRGLIGIVTTSTRGISMVPTRGTQPVLGTNPFAFAAPAGKYDPLVLDFATTVAAVNKVKVRKLRELELPEGWVNDGDGQAVLDPNEAINIFDNKNWGGLNPVGGIGETLGGHKGYGLAIFSHILSGAMSGASFSPIRVKNSNTDTPDDLGHYFQAINPESFRTKEEYDSDIEVVIETLRAVKPRDPEKPVLVPGEPEQISRKDRTKNGIPVNRNLRNLIREIAQNANVEYLLENPTIE
jgi:LDH2 family malate/lactate/ureidoglycolate dehydrogenase